MTSAWCSSAANARTPRSHTGLKPASYTRARTALVSRRDRVRTECAGPDRRAGKVRMQESAHARQQELQIVNERGEKLAATWTDRGTGEVVVLCHGFRSKRDNRVNVALTDALTQLGTVRFDFHGNNESEGEFDYAGYAHEACDVRAVVQYCRTQLNQRVRGVLGHSKASASVLLYASMFPDEAPSRIIQVSGRFDMRTGVRERFGDAILEQLERDGVVTVQDDTSPPYRLRKSSLDERLALDMATVAHGFPPAPCALLSVHGSKDEVIPVTHAYDFERCVDPAQHTVVVIDGACHRFVQPEHLRQLVQHCISFLEA
ncbi:hypothetical protein FVE85_3392 [Porphyridium purpureum]|uniref:Serine aminopeptidase S33 domain-containing protein n=1 Tax=Porphyridium purpureum TaxID=35688 RepID=A0A5J4YUG2_PORPP|nr:hypothetical protein FVE85_3392 [Porphyridium purpureum]|eukprot:POR0293..scf227_4